MKKRTVTFDGIRHTRPKKKFNPKSKPAGKTESFRMPISSRDDFPTSQNKNLAKADESLLRIIPIGGNEEVGRNMTIFEYGKDIVIVDMGLMFP
ncbi:MAG: hypothetical protein ACOYS2_01970 [Patescibacteria group bacterium]